MPAEGPKGRQGTQLLDLYRRNASLAFILYTLRALGFKILVAKGARGREVTRCRVVFTHSQCDPEFLWVSAKILERLPQPAWWLVQQRGPQQGIAEDIGESGMACLLHPALHFSLDEIASGTRNADAKCAKTTGRKRLCSISVGLTTFASSFS